MREVQKLRDLLERVSAADGPDREIDRTIAMLFGRMNGNVPVCAGYVGIGSFTASIDAAVRLMEQMLPGWGRMTYWNNCQGHLCAVEDNANEYEGSTMRTFEATGATASLAILSALLRALISQAEGEGA